MGAAEEGFLETDVGGFDAGDYAVGVNADEGDDDGSPAFDFRFEELAAGAEFVVCEFIGTRGGSPDDVGDAEAEVEEERSFEGGEESRRESASVEGGPKSVAGAAKVAADGGGVEAGVDTGEEDNEVFGGEVGDEFVMRGEDLGFGGFPGRDYFQSHRRFAANTLRNRGSVARRCQEENWVINQSGCNILYNAVLNHAENSHMAHKPRCIIVTGRPGSGKSTLSKELGKLLCMPVISRDEIKEGYVNTFGVRHDELPGDSNGVATETFFETVSFLLARKVSLIAEAAFQHPAWESRMDSLTVVASVCFVICSVDGETAAQRHLQRGLNDPKREFYHGDKRVAVFRERGILEPAGEYRCRRLICRRWRCRHSMGICLRWMRFAILWPRLVVVGCIRSGDLN